MLKTSIILFEFRIVSSFLETSIVNSLKIKLLTSIICIIISPISSFCGVPHKYKLFYNISTCSHAGSFLLSINLISVKFNLKNLSFFFILSNKCIP